MSWFKRNGDSKHESYGAGSWTDAIAASNEHGGAVKQHGAHPGKGQPNAHFHNADGSIINMYPNLRDPLDYDDD